MKPKSCKLFCPNVDNLSTTIGFWDLRPRIRLGCYRGSLALT